MKRLLVSPHRVAVLEGVRTLLHLPIWRRMIHAKARRTVGIMSLGIVVMLTGSLIASERELIGHAVGVHHLVFDTLGYFLHAAGAIPALRYVEPFWLLLTGE